MQGGKRLSRDEVPFRWLYEWVQALVTVVLCAVVVFAFAARLVLVSGPSMRETLQDQDCLLVLNAPLCGGFETGDIVIIQRDDFRDGEPIVKRIVATEGQTVDIDFNTGTVYVDGQALDEPYAKEPTYTTDGTEFPLTQKFFAVGEALAHLDYLEARGQIHCRETAGKRVYFAGAGDKI